jgi:hypothetical protein
LIKNKQLNRRRLQGLSLYTNIDPDIDQKQVEKRLKRIESPLRKPFVASIEQTISVLVEAIRAEKILAPAATVSARLTAQGMSISVDQVEQIYSQHGLKAGKKTADPP